MSKPPTKHQYPIARVSLEISIIKNYLKIQKTDIVAVEVEKRYGLGQSTFEKTALEKDIEMNTCIGMIAHNITTLCQMSS
jgi:hypothetical protein